MHAVHACLLESVCPVDDPISNQVVGVDMRTGLCVKSVFSWYSLDGGAEGKGQVDGVGLMGE